MYCVSKLEKVRSRGLERVLLFHLKDVKVKCIVVKARKIKRDSSNNLSWEFQQRLKPFLLPFFFFFLLLFEMSALHILSQKALVDFPGTVSVTIRVFVVSWHCRNAFDVFVMNCLKSHLLSFFKQALVSIATGRRNLSRHVWRWIQKHDGGSAFVCHDCYYFF